MNDTARIQAALQDSIDVKRRFVETQLSIVLKICDRLTQVLQSGGTIYLCGNGGSAADAQHIAAEFVGRFLRERRALPAVALTTNTSILTAIGNDYDFRVIFSRQVQAQARPGDAVVGISTSGKSPNVLAAMAAAREIGATAIGFTGEPGEPLGQACDLCLKVPTSSTPRIQEVHIMAWHMICDIVEQRIVDQK
ncbi:MAG: SIS domain-containing protein [Gemmataceae bacterium]|nr:SIS domain-containing protein [Gemmataceae bacterium]